MYRGDGGKCREDGGILTGSHGMLTKGGRKAKDDEILGRRREKLVKGIHF